MSTIGWATEITKSRAVRAASAFGTRVIYNTTSSHQHTNVTDVGCGRGLLQGLERVEDELLHTQVTVFLNHKDEDAEELSHRYDNIRVELEYPLLTCGRVYSDNHRLLLVEYDHTSLVLYKMYNYCVVIGFANNANSLFLNSPSVILSTVSSSAIRSQPIRKQSPSFCLYYSICWRSETTLLPGNSPVTYI